MAYLERVGSLHVHTLYSDGTGSVPEVAEAANQAGLDYVIVTDHNAYHPEHAGWHGRTLVLVGQELHDPHRPHENHLLVVGAGRDLAAEGGGLQGAIEAARAAGGLPFLAHPIERSGAYLDEPEINWVDRQVTGYAGIELWNYMSEFKSHARNRATALAYALWPALAMLGPYPETLQLWDELLEDGMTYAVCGPDAHAQRYAMGPIRRTVFGYRHLFEAIQLHALIDGPWTGRLAEDEALVYAALASGRSFVGYDGIAPAVGARFVAEDAASVYTVGQTVRAQGAVWLRGALPARARMRLLRGGQVVQQAHGSTLAYQATEPGVYRLEAYRRHLGRERGWVFFNPIRIVKYDSRDG